MSFEFEWISRQREEIEFRFEFDLISRQREEFKRLHELLFLTGGIVGIYEGETVGSCVGLGVGK